MNWLLSLMTPAKAGKIFCTLPVISTHLHPCRLVNFCSLTSSRIEGFSKTKFHQIFLRSGGGSSVTASLRTRKRFDTYFNFSGRICKLRIGPLSQSGSRGTRNHFKWSRLGDALAFTSPKPASNLRIYISNQIAKLQCFDGEMSYTANRQASQIREHLWIPIDDIHSVIEKLQTSSEMKLGLLSRNTPAIQKAVSRLNYQNHCFW